MYNIFSYCNNTMSLIVTISPMIYIINSPNCIQFNNSCVFKHNIIQIKIVRFKTLKAITSIEHENTKRVKI